MEIMVLKLIVITTRTKIDFDVTDSFVIDFDFQNCWRFGIAISKLDGTGI